MAETGKLRDDPLWFKDAVFYEVYVRGFYDSNGDGVGDFRGLTEKLDYLEWLGVDCLWLLPMYASPLRDGGYDIADYYAILPEYGTLEDFRQFIDAAHARGIRVITDLVVNHTSDQHPWFVEACGSPDSPKRDWTWSEAAQGFYWHRFFSHQPDLNYDNPDVQQAMLDAVDYWLDFGIDGFRADAVPYLYEREGTNCENLPETHAFLKK